MVKFQDIKDGEIYYFSFIRFTEKFNVSANYFSKISARIVQEDPKEIGLCEVKKIIKYGRKFINVVIKEKDRFYLEHLFDNYEEAKEYYNSVIQDNLDRLQSWYETKKENISKKIENLPDEKP